MQNQIYKIDENQLDNIKKRTLIKAFKLYGFVILLVGSIQYFEWGQKDPRLFILSTLGIIPFMLIPAYIGTNKLKKAYSTLEIVLNQSGIEAKAEMMPYKKINWNNLLIEEKSNGAINLYDKSISVFMRKMYGKGLIVVQPETMNKQALLNELIKYQQPN